MATLATVTLRGQEDLHRLAGSLTEFVFRGQASANWPLATALERALDRCSFITDLLGSVLLTNREHWMLHEFKRQARIYIQIAPSDDDDVEWLAIMQHYGCPTRLLDFTYSAYIAAYFAVVDAEADSAIWALHWPRLRDSVQASWALPYQAGSVLRDYINSLHLQLANGFIGERAVEKASLRSGCINLEPKRFTERIARQRGLFVMPTNPEEGFMANLRASYSVATKEPDTQFDTPSIEEVLVEAKGSSDRWPILKLVVPRDLRGEIVAELTRMNITASSMFGGLDGLARSLLQTVLWEL
jgi:FRG domain